MTTQKCCRCNGSSFSDVKATQVLAAVYSHPRRNVWQTPKSSEGQSQTYWKLLELLLVEWFGAGDSICTDSDSYAKTGAQSVDHLYRDVPVPARPSRPCCKQMTHKNHLTHKQEIPEELLHLHTAQFDIYSERVHWGVVTWWQKGLYLTRCR